MKQAFLISALFLASFNLFSQTSYSGFINNYPIELITEIYSNSDVSAVYAYSNFDEPIMMDGRLQKNKLKLFEKGKNGKNKATLIFENYNATADKLEGIWTDLLTKKQLAIRLTKMFDIDHDSNENSSREILQAVSLGNQYFKLIVSNKQVTGIKILEKKTDKLIQQIALDCQFRGLRDVSIEDYNFDGITDFSVFESSYAGPNTSSLYFLYDKKTSKYVESGFSGTSLTFDSKTKRIHETNQCCAGSSVINAEYKVENNKMVLVKQRCYKWDEKKQGLVERKMKDCQ